MSIKPNRELLNVNFDGYKLASDSLPCISQEFVGGVRIATPHDDHFSYQHMRYFTTHNHLIPDPWNGSCVYWYGTSGDVLCGSMGPSGELQVSTVFSTTASEQQQQHSHSVNASLCFLTEQLCLFTNGSGSLLLLDTTDRSRSINQPPSWNVIVDVTPRQLEGIPLIIQCTALASIGLTLDVGLLQLKYTASIGHSGRTNKPSICIFHCYRINFSHSLLSLGTLDRTDVDVTSASLSCSFESTTIPLHTEFIEESLVVVSESTLRLSIAAEETVEEVEEERGDSDVEEVSEEPSSLSHPGIGYKEATQVYEWSQSDSDVTVSVPVPHDVSKRDISCVIEPDNLVIGLTDGTTFVRGKLFARIDCEVSAWILETNRIEVTLEKAEPGLHWPVLVNKGSQQGHTHLPLSEGLEGLTAQEIERLQEQIQAMSNSSGHGRSEENGDTPSSPKRRCRPIIQNTLEDCDTLDNEDVAIFVLAQDGSISQRIGLGGRQLLFTLPPSPFSSSLLCIRHDIDALVYSPKIESKALLWTHIGTFNALGYVQASKREKKFLTASSDLSFAVLCDCTRHVFVYQQPKGGVKGPTALQYIHTVTMKREGCQILGVHGSARGLVFILCEGELLVLINEH